MPSTPRTSEGLLRLLRVLRYTGRSGWVAFFRPRKLRFHPFERRQRMERRPSRVE